MPSGSLSCSFGDRLQEYQLRSCSWGLWAPRRVSVRDMWLFPRSGGLSPLVSFQDEHYYLGSMFVPLIFGNCHVALQATGFTTEACNKPWAWSYASNRDPVDHIDIKILHPGSKAQYKGDSRNHGCLRSLCLCSLWGPYQRDFGSAVLAPRTTSGEPWSTVFARGLQRDHIRILITGLLGCR